MYNKAALLLDVGRREEAQQLLAEVARDFAESPSGMARERAAKAAASGAGGQGESCRDATRTTGDGSRPGHPAVTCRMISKCIPSGTSHRPPQVNPQCSNADTTRGS